MENEAQPQVDQAPSGRARNWTQVLVSRQAKTLLFPPVTELNEPVTQRFSVNQKELRKRHLTVGERGSKENHPPHLSETDRRGIGLQRIFEVQIKSFRSFAELHSMGAGLPGSGARLCHPLGDVGALCACLSEGRAGGALPESPAGQERSRNRPLHGISCPSLRVSQLPFVRSSERALLDPRVQCGGENAGRAIPTLEAPILAQPPLIWIKRPGSQVLPPLHKVKTPILNPDAPFQVRIPRENLMKALSCQCPTTNAGTVLDMF